ncbi:MAG TPA: PIN domain-containing protein [Candidatus Limnocylindria bacterium]|nr:PIN domain-containing protein [Candidatus Limnocylindria bacterium]
MIVLDANILIRAVLGRRARQLIDTYADQSVRFFGPDVAFDDAEKYLPSLLKKRGKPRASPRRRFGNARILAKHHRAGYSRTLRRL